MVAKTDMQKHQLVSLLLARVVVYAHDRPAVLQGNTMTWNMSCFLVRRSTQPSNVLQQHHLWEEGEAREEG